MGVCEIDDCKTTKITEKMVAIRVSDKFPPISTPLDCEDNPNKKIKLVHEIQPLFDNVDEELEFGNGDGDGDGDGDDDDDEEDVDESINDAEPIGDVIRVSDDSGETRNHFRGFQFDGFMFNLEDTVLVAPEEGKVKPSVAIIKDIFQPENGNLTVHGLRFFRPEEAEKKEGGTWESNDARELFYSSCLDEVDTCNVMHKCVVHLVPMGQALPDRKQHPGFIVQKFYNFTTKNTRNLTEKDCEGFLSQPGATVTA